MKLYKAWWGGAGNPRVICAPCLAVVDEKPETVRQIVPDEESGTMTCWECGEEFEAEDLE